MVSGDILVARGIDGSSRLGAATGVESAAGFVACPEMVWVISGPARVSLVIWGCGIVAFGLLGVWSVTGLMLELDGASP